jgi:hypothetical protein
MAKAKKYPDTLAGAISYLRAEGPMIGLALAIGRPDPQVQGVWEVNVPRVGRVAARRHIVYLSGYPDPLGKIRTENDFETED